jgi:glycerophosphoryl diester phosphodiesterase
MHDESLVRTTDVASRFPNDPRASEGYLVADFDFDEIRSLDAGSWFLSDAGGKRSAQGFGSRDRVSEEDMARILSGQIRVPSLRECLEVTVRLDWLANIELKLFPDADTRLLEVVAAEVTALGASDRILVSSFDHNDAGRAAALELEWATGVLAETPIFKPARYVREVVGVDCFHTSCLSLGSGSKSYRRRPVAENLRTGDVEDLVREEVPVLVYTVNDAAPEGLAVQLARAGVNGLFTDDPVAIRGLLDSFRA